MAAGFGSELIRYIKPKMKAELIVQPTLSLEIKLRLEKLRLAELICANESRTGWEPAWAATARSAESS